MGGCCGVVDLGVVRGIVSCNGLDQTHVPSIDRMGAPKRIEASMVRKPTTQACYVCLLFVSIYVVVDTSSIEFSRRAGGGGGAI